MTLEEIPELEEECVGLIKALRAYFPDMLKKGFKSHNRLAEHLIKKVTNTRVLLSLIKK